MTAAEGAGLTPTTLLELAARVEATRQSIVRTFRVRVEFEIVRDRFVTLAGERG